MSELPDFGKQLRALRTERCWSLRELADRIRFNRGYIGKVEQGEKFPERQFAELADHAFSARGTLLTVWEYQAAKRHEAEQLGRILTASVADSLHLVAAAETQLELDELDRQTERLAVDYLGTTPGPMLIDAVNLRAEVLQRLKRHHYHPQQIRDLYLELGRIQGVLAYAALDLGEADGAMTHADAAWQCAERAGDNELRAWVRGTQSLIARFQADYAQALWYVRDGLYYPAPGTGGVRLLCGVAQCLGNVGDSPGVNRALDKAQDQRAKVDRADSIGGLFEFSEAKQHYYAGSSLIWLQGGADAERAVREAAEAIRMWEAQPPETRSLDDEALAHIYQATAHLQLDELDAATEALRPILDLPAERRISWIKKRIARLADMLRAEPYATSSVAGDLYDEIRAFIA